MTLDAAPEGADLPELLTVEEVAVILRTSVEAAYAQIARGQVAGVLRRGRRVFVRRDELRRSLGLGS